MSKRKITDSSDIESCKKIRDDIFYNVNNINEFQSDHEKQFLLDTNRKMVEFVHKSVQTMEIQKKEIDRLNDVLLKLSVALANSESKNTLHFRNGYVF